MTREDWLLSQPWRDGIYCAAIVCDHNPASVSDINEEARQFYGGGIIAESCTRKVRAHIIALHNLAPQLLNVLDEVAEGNEGLDLEQVDALRASLRVVMP